jgi:hypothetical protein
MVRDAMPMTRCRRVVGALIAGLMVISGSGGNDDVSGMPASSSVAQTDGWLTRTDVLFAFEIRHPEGYVTLEEPVLPASTQPPVLQRLRFQEKQIALGLFAEREPPRLSIDIFARSPAVPLREWLQSQNLLPARATLAVIQLAGAREGLRVTLPQQIAPNEFLYFSTDRYVYRLVALGGNGAAMLASFRLLGER